MRQIHSDLAESARKKDLNYTLAIIVLGALVTFIGFMGADRLVDSIAPLLAHTVQVSAKVSEVGFIGHWDRTTSKRIVELLFNLLVLLLFIASLLNLIYRWKENQTVHFQGVVRLTQFSNWLDEQVLLNLHSADIHALREIRRRYQEIVDSLPPNDERDYLRAKRNLTRKSVLAGDVASEPTSRAAQTTEMADEQFIHELVKSSPLLICVLRRLQTVDSKLWLGGGAIRNHIWDTLTGRVTPLDDFDVVYHDKDDKSYEHDIALEAEIMKTLPKTLRISVKNQARMHMTTGEPEAHSFTEAIESWPETATAIAMRLDQDSKLEVLAPYGFDDLLNMIVRPTPYHRLHRNSFEARKIRKDWKSHWPEIDFADESSDGPQINEVGR